MKPAFRRALCLAALASPALLGAPAAAQWASTSYDPTKPVIEEGFFVLHEDATGFLKVFSAAAQRWTTIAPPGTTLLGTGDWTVAWIGPDFVNAYSARRNSQSALLFGGQILHAYVDDDVALVLLQLGHGLPGLGIAFLAGEVFAIALAWVCVRRLAPGIRVRVFGASLERIPVSSNKSQIGHSLGATAAIEAALAVEGLQQGVILPTINHLPDPKFDDIDVVPNTARQQPHEFLLTNAFGFGGTNCCIVLRGL